MTAPRDDISGLSERPRADVGQRDIYRTDATLLEAAAKLDALQARVKELEAQLAVADATLLRLNSGKELQDMMRLNNDLKFRATRLQQERDEAVDLLRKMTDHSIDDALYPFAECFDTARDLIRRLAGPEKEKKE